MALIFSTKNGDCALVVQLMNEINESVRIAFRASLKNDAITVEQYDRAIARKLRQCASVGFPLHIPNSCKAENGREIGEFRPDGWSYVLAADASEY